MDEIKKHGERIRLIAFPSKSIDETIIKINIKRIVYLTTISIPIRLLTILSFFSKEGTSDKNISNWKKWIIISHGLILLFNLVVNFIARKVRKKPEAIAHMKGIQYIFILVILLSGIVITLIDQLVTISINPYIITYISIGTIFLIKPLYSLLYFLAGYLLFYIGMGFMKTDQVLVLSNKINGLSITALAILLSLIIWTNNVKNLQQKEVIEFQQEKLQKTNKKLKILSTLDPLTGLINRRSFEEKAEEVLVHLARVGGESSFIILDLDNFKSQNDKYGHPLGDEILRQFSDLLRSQFRDSDIIARLGGDEFAILLKDTNIQVGKGLAENLREIINSKTFHIDGHKINISTSIGIAPINDKTTSFEMVYRLVDKELYKDKAKKISRIEEDKNLINIVKSKYK